MRILGYTEKWDKLKKPIHTTFRLPRKDADKGRDWAVNEFVQEYYRPRSPKRKFLQIAQIISKEPKTITDITNKEAIEDGFPEGRVEMWRFLMKAHKGLKLANIINKLTINVKESK